MKTASITELKNNASALLKRVRRGESILITDRKEPIARLQPIQPSDESSDARLARLEKAGILKRGKGKLSKTFWTRPLPKLPKGASLLQAVLDERREGR
jgi:prevent-host-death family protein